MHCIYFHLSKVPPMTNAMTEERGWNINQSLKKQELRLLDREFNIYKIFDYVFYIIYQTSIYLIFNMKDIYFIHNVKDIYLIYTMKDDMQTMCCREVE